MFNTIKAENTQVGGNHYVDIKIQPCHITYELNESPLFMNIAECISRCKDDKLLYLQKALHCIHLESEIVDNKNSYGCLFIDGDLILIDGGDIIQEFAMQFTYSSLIMNILLYVHEGQYASAKESVSLLIDEVSFDEVMQVVEYPYGRI